MKRFSFIAGLMLLLTALSSQAQYYQIANQIPQLLSPALSGSLNYKGYVELSGLAGLGTNRANFVGVATTQGFRYASWFFMGVGAGVDMVIAQQSASYSPKPGYGYTMSYNTATKKAMIPLYSDFRFNFGPASGLSFFIDLKLGASWLIGSDYLQMNDAYMSSSAQFYFKPSAGLRIPVSQQQSKQAFNVGIVYQLITSNNNYYRNSNTLSLNSIGIGVSYEW